MWHTENRKKEGERIMNYDNIPETFCELILYIIAYIVAFFIVLFVITATITAPILAIAYGLQLIGVL